MILAQNPGFLEELGFSPVGHSVGHACNVTTVLQRAYQVYPSVIRMGSS